MRISHFFHIRHTASIESLSKWSSTRVAILSDCFCFFITSTWWYWRKKKMVELPYNIHALARVQWFRPPYSAYNSEARRMKCKFPFDWLPCTISTSLNWSILSMKCALRSRTHETSWNKCLPLCPHLWGDRLVSFFPVSSNQRVRNF